LRKNADAIRGRTVIRVAVGDQDDLRIQNKTLDGLLTELKIQHEFEIVPGVAHNGAVFYRTLGAGAVAYYQKAINSRQPSAANYPNAVAKSHVLQRGDAEIVTFESEQDYDRLQELYRKSQDTEVTPGTMTALYYRSRLDGSVQPYAVRLPAGFTRD